MNEMREVKDLAIGNVIQVDGFDDNMTVRAAKKVKKGLDAGKLHVTLAAPDGEAEVIALDPAERVKVVGKAAQAGKGAPKAGKSAGRTKGKGKAKGKAKAKPETEVESAASPESEIAVAPGTEAETASAPETTAPEAATSEPATPKKASRQKKAAGEKKMGCLDAAAKVLAEAGTAMNCQNLIKAVADRGLWTSARGRTPHATLYSAILREINTKGAKSRFEKVDRGQFRAKA